MDYKLAFIAAVVIAVLFLVVGVVKAYKLHKENQLLKEIVVFQLTKLLNSEIPDTIVTPNGKIDLKEYKDNK
jgi:hypothetical protein